MLEKLPDVCETVKFITMAQALKIGASDATQSTTSQIFVHLSQAPLSAGLPPIYFSHIYKKRGPPHSNSEACKRFISYDGDCKSGDCCIYQHK